MLNRLIRMGMNALVRTGIEHGVDAAARNRTEKADPNSPEGRAARAQAAQTSKRAKQAMRLLRRMIRF